MSDMVLHPLLRLLTPLWENSYQTIHLASRLAMQRNIDKFCFPGKMSSDRRQQVVALVLKQLGHCALISDPQALKGEEMHPLDKEFVMEHFLSLASFQQVHSGEAFAFDQGKSSFMLGINLQDHLQLVLIDPQAELEESWNWLTSIENQLGEQLGYAYSPTFGFLTADPHSCGTALHASLYLQLPALQQTRRLQRLLKELDGGVTAVGLQGSPTEFVGDLVVLQNSYTLGLTEEKILSLLRGAMTKLELQEVAARKEISQNAHPEIKDHVSRAYGILLHSYQLEVSEALNALSLLKLGTEVGWVEGIEMNQLHRLFFGCRRAHLLHHLGTHPPSDGQEGQQLLHLRADYLHKGLQNAVLKI